MIDSLHFTTCMLMDFTLVEFVEEYIDSVTAIAITFHLFIFRIGLKEDKEQLRRLVGGIAFVPSYGTRAHHRGHFYLYTFCWKSNL